MRQRSKSILAENFEDFYFQMKTHEEKQKDRNKENQAINYQLIDFDFLTLNDDTSISNDMLAPSMKYKIIKQNTSKPLKTLFKVKQMKTILQFKRRIRPLHQIQVNNNSIVHKH
jgi:hypothetical protein